MIRVLLPIIVVCLSLSAGAQMLTVESFKTLDGDISARMNRIDDLNGNSCALLKIWTMDNLVEIQGNNIGAVTQKEGGEKWIYLINGSRDVKLFFDRHLPIELKFNDYGIKELKSNTTYLLVLTENGGRPIISSTPDESLKIKEYPARDEFELGLSYLKGLNGHKVDYDKAKNFLFPSADKGNGDAQYYLSLMYASGMGVDKNPQEAVRWLMKAADNMQIEALRELGKRYVDGRDIEKDEVLGTFMTSMAADRGNATAMNDMGYFYSKGIAYDQNKTEALRYYQMAADRGNVIAMSNVAKIYYNGDGIEQNLAKSAEYFEKAARLGDAQSQYNLGVLYEKGWGVEQNMKQAIKWWKRAAEQGHFGASEALFKVGK